MSRPDYEDEMRQAELDEYERMRRENCEDFKFQLDEHSIEIGWIGGSEIVMATLECENSGIRVHVEGVIER